MGRVLSWQEFEPLAAAGYPAWEAVESQATPGSEAHGGPGGGMFRPTGCAPGLTWDSWVRNLGTRRPLPVCIYVRRPPYTPSFIDDLHRWCRDHLRGDCHLGGPDHWVVECHFQFVDDAALFRLFHG